MLYLFLLHEHKVGEPDLSVVINGTHTNMLEYAVINGTYPKLDFDIRLLGNRSNLLFPSAYNLGISLAPRKNNDKVADKAVMMTTIFVHEGVYLTRYNVVRGMCIGLCQY